MGCLKLHTEDPYTANNVVNHLFVTYRKTCTGTYRFAFNGQERETEIKQGTFSAEYWMYSSQLGRRWDLDPVDNAFHSNYSTFGNNPIANVDANGDNHVFYMKNNKLYMKDTKEGTQIQIRSGNQLFSLSQFPLNTKENRKIVAKIVAYYSKQVNVNGVVGIFLGSKSSSENPAFTTESQTEDNEGKLAIYVNTNGGINPNLNDFNNLKNTLVHENKHKTNGDVELFEDDNYTFYKHANVYLHQIKDVSFNNTTTDHKVNITGRYFAFLISAAKNGDIGRDQIYTLVDNYNKLNTGITVSTDTPYLGSKDFSFKFEYKDDNGKQQERFVDINKAPATPN